jgi:NADPH:quinone reductase-like Zn-dependent oxidoreductase
MKAVVQDTYGSPDVLELREIDRPVVGDDELLVRVHAAGVDPGVWHLMTGLPYLVRVMGYGCARPRSAPGAGMSPGGWRRSATT